MADAELALDLTDNKQEESGDSQADEGETEPQQTQENTNGVKTDAEEKPEPKEKSSGGRKSHRYHPYKERHGGGGGSGDKKAAHRNRVFISNIPYDMKWQAIKDLMREKGNPRRERSVTVPSSPSLVSVIVVEFKDEEFVKKAIEVMSKHDLNGRPLNIKEDPDGDHARRVLQRSGRMYGGGRGQDGGPSGMNIPPSIANNPNIPPDIISALQAGRLGTTVFVANLDFKVGWKKLKEVFGMAGTVRRADVKEDKDGKSRGMGTVTFEQPLEAVQAISMFNSQMLFDRQMHVKMDDKSLPPDDIRPAEKPPQLPRGLGGIGMGLGPGGQPINANRLSGGGVASMGPGGMDGPGCSSMNRMSGMGGGFSSMECMGGMGGFGGRDMGPMGRMGGQVMYAEIKMENGKSKGCGTVRFDSPESAEKACRMMNGTKINGREVDVRIDRNA
ncbi:Myelin expression factor 2 [Anabarilius grahami]|uniref:Myelin expression factor 2 n=1 Tax=Anabarilius grahami TaxID=495550 RepID=A0A3N0Y815_ANAGA|nr:Myelin expression factor 2 [Anabarilius grahami]